MASSRVEIVRCDRCNATKEYEVPLSAARHNDWGKMSWQWSLGSSYVKEYDLCGNCRYEFSNWMGMREKLNEGSEDSAEQGD